HEHDVRLWELSPHQASLEEAYMRMTQGAVDYRSTIDQKEGLQQPLPPGAQPVLPVPGQGQPGWYAPPPPQEGGQPFTPPQGAPAGPYGAPTAPGAAPGAAAPNPYAQAPQGPAPAAPPA
ncbi:ABC transporter ATP-binding protein, partial [Streptomyces sp. PAL114]|nr:ABC transporter ATP-binding protein [Streptomyces sp. PAL114]